MTLLNNMPTSEGSHQLASFNEELNKLVEGKLRIGIHNKENFALFMSFVIGKAFKTHEALMLLCKKGYGEDAFMLARTLFELGVMSSYILQDPTEKILRRYLEHDWVTRKEMYDYVITKDDLLESLNKEMEARLTNPIEEVGKEYSRVMKEYQYKPHGGWSDKSISKMAESIGRKDMYDTVYRVQCTVSHANARSMNEYVKEDTDGGMVINIGPNEDLTEKTLVIAFDLFRMIIEDADKTFEWDLEPALDSIYKRFIETASALNVKN
jgi:hypothetical protein